VPTVGAYLLTQIALRRAEPSLVATYIYLQPILAALGAMAILGERPGARTATAAALIFGGVFLSGRVRGPHP
jgi:drug/metabolite transporter (DMT)-like permease